jgi:hypothetical protein
MGLDISHDAFRGAYSAFNRLRQVIAKAMGGSFPPHTDRERYPDENKWYASWDYTRGSHPGLYAFMNHSDCEGDIPPGTAEQLADELEELLPKIEDRGIVATGHIAERGGYPAVVRKLIAGCRLAAERDESLEFL